MSGRCARTIGALLLSILAGTFFIESYPAGGSPAGTQRMAETLDKVIDGIDVLENLYLNRERAEHLRAELAKKPDTRTELGLRMRLARELLTAGDSAEAAVELEEIRRISAASSYPLSTRQAGMIRDLLAISYLRVGEQENCVLNHTIDSCLLPIGPGGVHQAPEGSRAAIRELTAALEADPEDLTSRWLLNIAYMTLGEHPAKVPPAWLIPASSFDSEYDIGRFRDVAPALGLDTIGLAGGSIMEDFDGDGLLDIMASSSGLRDPLQYFRNNGDGTFTDLSESAGLLSSIKSLNLVPADYNNDGFPDVLMLRGAWMHRQGRYPNSLLRNNGDNTFEDVTIESGLLSFHPTQTAAWGDYDNDGWLDLYIGNESDPNEPHPCELLRNDGDGTFTQVARSVGLDVVGYVKGVAWGDYNNDGRPDLYVSRLGQQNVLFRNDGPVGDGEGWKFTDVTREAAVKEPIEAFATWFWDYDNDGWQDLFVAGYHWESLDDIAAVHLGMPSPAERHRLYRNRGDGTFSDVTEAANLDSVLLTMAANFGDLDNDGYLDATFGTGEPDYRSLMPNRVYRNAGGETFQDVTTSGGFGHLQKGHGISFGDLDNDGDQDIYQVLGGAYSGDRYQNVLYENPGHGNHWLTLKLVGVKSNRSALGARIRVELEGSEGARELHRTVGTGGSFGASSLQQEMGLGEATSIGVVTVTWPASETVQRFEKLEMDRAYEIREGDRAPRALDRVRFQLSRPGGHDHRGPAPPEDEPGARREP